MFNLLHGWIVLNWKLIIEITKKKKKDPDVRKVDLEVQDASDRKNVYCSELFWFVYALFPKIIKIDSCMSEL